MDKNNRNILLVDTDSLHLKVIEKKLKKIGYENLTVADTFEKAVTYLSGNHIDLIILDYYLDGNYTGKELIKENLMHGQIPVIFVSTFYGPELYEEIKDMIPMDFLPMSVSEFELEKSIDLAFRRKNKSLSSSPLKEYIFVKNGKDIKKLKLSDINYITVDGKYLELNTHERRYLIRSTLYDFEKRLPEAFIKIHKAYIINIDHLDLVNIEEGMVKIGEKIVPFSRTFKRNLLSLYYLT